MNSKDTRNTLWVFDVDGVLTHPSEKKVTEPVLFDEIIKRLKKGDPVALNTGRSLEYIEEQVVAPLLGKVGDQNSMDAFLGVAEKGVIWEMFTDGKREACSNPNYSVPKEIQDAVRDVVQRSFSDVAFYDETKQTMVSVEMHDGFDVEVFWERQKELNNQMQKILDDHKQGNNFVIDPTRIATDIQAKGTGKNFGAQQILRWVASREIWFSNVICFGDSASDVAMAEEFVEQGLETVFVYVGKKGDMGDFTNRGFEVVYTEADCEAGTMEFLQQ